MELEFLQKEGTLSALNSLYSNSSCILSYFLFCTKVLIS
uniref:Uncharacterized protein n=1 Tax=Rhizophora mucronata TaxID=61149 RepID=A0A2P2JZH5_RHIMU